MAIVNLRYREVTDSKRDLFQYIQEQDIRENIEFIKPEDTLIYKTGGYSGNITLECLKQNKTHFFIKIMENSENLIEDIEEIYRIYHKCYIPTARIIEKGNFKNLEICYIIYSFCEGILVGDLLAELTIEECLSIGNKIGKQMRKLSKVKENKIKDKIELSVISKDTIQKLDYIYTNDKEEVKFYFTKEQFQKIKENLICYEKEFEKEELHLIHEDIKLGNIILNVKNQKLTIIDCEKMKYGYEIFNIQWAIYSSLNASHNREKYQSFIKGYIQEIYQNKIPLNIYKQIYYICIVSFAVELEASYGKRDIKRFYNILKIHKEMYNFLDEFDKKVDYLNLF